MPPRIDRRWCDVCLKETTHYLRSGRCKACIARASMTQTVEQLREVGRLGALVSNANLTPERRSEMARMGRMNINALNARLTPEQRRANARRGGAAAQEARTPEQRSEIARLAVRALHTKRTPEQRRVFAFKAGMSGGYRSGRVRLGLAIERKREHIAALEQELSEATS